MIKGLSGCGGGLAEGKFWNSWDESGPKVAYDQHQGEEGEEGRRAGGPGDDHAFAGVGGIGQAASRE